jgi:hypothetical protein
MTKESDYDEVMKQIDGLMGELEKSDLIKGLNNEDRENRLSTAYQFMESGCNYCYSDPQELNELDMVKEIMLEWIPRKVGGDDAHWKVFPDGVILALRFLGGKYSWKNTDELVDWVDKNRARFIKEANDPRNFGMAKSMVAMMQRDGVDITDKKATDKWLANYNMSREMEHLGLDEEDNLLMEPIRNFAPKTSRNAPCPCGSGKKYKKCCGFNAPDIPPKPKPPIPVITPDTPEYTENYSEQLLPRNYDVPLEEWRSLYELAIQLKNLAPWDWIFEDEMFGVQNPVTGEIGYVSIMGNSGEYLALAVYSGSKGLVSWQKFRDNAEQRELGKSALLDSAQLMMLQKCLMISFEDHADLTKQDIQLIQKLGFKFKGSQAWPLFRNYSPGYFPWYLTKEEVKYLTLVLQQAMEMARRIQKDGPEILEGQDTSQYLVRVAQNKDGTLVWSDQWLTPKPIVQPELKLTIDENRINRLKTVKPLKYGIWELDFFFLPTPVADKKERPFYPYTLLCLDRTSNYILTNDMAKQSDYIPQFSNKFIESLENAKALPIEICIRKNEVHQWLSPITEQLGIRLTLAKKLPVLNKAVTEMLNFMR